jgi:Uma2 family endonuclease
MVWQTHARPRPQQMSVPAQKLAVYQDLLRLPDDVRAEILAGHVITAPAPLPKHSKAQRALGNFVGGPFDDDDGHGGPGGWWIFVEVDIQFGPHDVVRPDLSGWRRERLVNPGEQRPIEVAPDWVCEILSPSTAARDKVAKRKLYAKHGVRHYWIVDVDARTLEAFELSDGRWMLVDSYDDTAVARIRPFDEVELTIQRLFLPVQENLLDR